MGGINILLVYARFLDFLFFFIFRKNVFSILQAVCEIASEIYHTRQPKLCLSTLLNVCSIDIFNHVLCETVGNLGGAAVH